MTDETDERRDRSTASARSLIGLPSGGAGDQVPLFSSDPGVPRRRRAADAVRLILHGTAFVLLGWVASGEPEIDARLIELVADLPSWLRTLAWVAYSASALLAVLLLAAGVASRQDRSAVFRDLICGLGTAVIGTIVAGRAATGVWPQVFPEFVELGDRLAYPTMRPVMVVIVVLVLGPYVNSNAQRWMRMMVVSVVVAPVLLGLTELTAILGAVALSFFSVAAVRLAFGPPDGLPTIDRLRATLERVGISVTSLAYLDDQPGTVGLARATASDGRALDIKVFGVDAAQRQQTERMWRNLWYRRAGPRPRAGREEQAQHEALAVLVARDSGINVPAPVGAGRVDSGDVLLVKLGPHGDALDDVAEPTVAQLSALWTELVSMHQRARVAHGSISPTTVRLEGESAEFVDLSQASVFPTEQQFGTDVVSMLVTHALVVGSERAVDVAASSVDRQILEAALPYVQDAVLDPSLRRRFASSDMDIEQLGEKLAERLDVERPEPAPVRRVSVKDVAIAIGAIVAANALITQIADIGFDTLIDELGNASVGWLVTAFLINLTAYGTAYLGLSALCEQPLPFSPTTLLQAAKSFVGLVVPSMVGRVGLDIRFLQKQGVPLGVASTQGPVISLLGFGVEVALLALSAWAIGQEIEIDGLVDFDAGGLVTLAGVVVVVALAVVAAVPRLRDTVVPFVRDAFGTVTSVLTSPRTLVHICTGEARDRLIKALALGATVAAFGASLPFAALVFVSVGTGLLAGLAPVPGGIGVAEATMSGLLSASGLPPEQAVSSALVHRLVTAYLPPVLGFFAFSWLTDEGYL